MKTTKPTISKEAELRHGVINAVCFKPGIMGHIEQFERIEALIADQQRQLLDRVLEQKEEACLDSMTDIVEFIRVQVINDIREGL